MRRIILTLAVLIVMAEAASAASQGTLGATSTGSSNLSVTTTEEIQITDIADITVAPYVGAAGVDSFGNVCIYTNDEETVGNTFVKRANPKRQF